MSTETLLKTALKNRNIRLSEASKMGIAYGTIYSHYRGSRNLSADAAIAYEELLGIPRHELRPDLWPPPAQPSHTSQTIARED